MDDGSKPVKDLRIERFVDLYILTLDAKKAALQAGFSKAEAKNAANSLLTMPSVIIKIQQKSEWVSTQIELSQTRVLAELKRIAFSLQTPVGVRLQALKLLAQYTGLLNPSLAVGVTIEDSTSMKVVKKLLSDSEIVERVKKAFEELNADEVLVPIENNDSVTTTKVNAKIQSRIVKSQKELTDAEHK